MASMASFFCWVDRLARVRAAWRVWVAIATNEVSTAAAEDTDMVFVRNGECIDPGYTLTEGVDTAPRGIASPTVKPGPVAQPIIPPHPQQ